MLIHSPKQHKSIIPSVRVHSKHEGTNMKCKPNCEPGGTLSKTRLASCSGGICAGSTGEYWLAAPARLAGYSAGSTGKGYSARTRRDPLASSSEILILGGIHYRAALVGCSAGSTGELLWRATLAGYSAGSTGELLWDTQRDARRDPLAGCSLGGIY